MVGALGDYDDFNLLPRSSARHLGLIPRRGGLLLPHTAGTVRFPHSYTISLANVRGGLEAY